MNVSTSSAHNLLQAYFPKLNLNFAQKIAIVLASSLALTISAKIQFPIGPVPFTMQTYVVLVLAVLLGKRLAAFSVLTYLAQGLAGLPVFAGGGGLAYIAMPSFGFLVGFLAAVLLIGHSTERGYGRNLIGSFVLMMAGHALLFVFGLMWLIPAFGLEGALMVGLYPFISMFLIKTALAAATVAAMWRVQRSGDK